MAIMAAHRVPYAATLSLAHRDDFLRKLRRGPSTRGLPLPAHALALPDRLEVGAGRDASSWSRLAVGLRPLPALRGVRRRAATASTRAPTARRWRTTSRGRGASLGRRRALDGLRAGIAEQWARLEALAASFPTTDVSVSSETAHRWLRVLVEDRPSVLARVAGQVSRRGVNIETVVVRSLPDRAHTYLTLGLDADERTAERVGEGHRAASTPSLDVEPFVGECPEPETEARPGLTGRRP